MELYRKHLAVSINRLTLFFYLTFTLSILLSLESTAQDNYLVHRVITQPQKMALMDYIDKAVRNHWFVQDIGILRVSEEVKQDGTVLWRVSTIIDDSYRKNPPREFAKVHGDIVLFYTKKSLPISNREKSIINKRLRKIVLDRVYIMPPKVNRNDTLRLGGLSSDEPVKGDDGEYRIFDSRRNCLDNCDHAIGYLFKFDKEKYEIVEVL